MQREKTGNWLLFICPSTAYEELLISDPLCVLVVDAGVDASMQYIICRQCSTILLTWNFNCRKHSWINTTSTATMHRKKKEKKERDSHLLFYCNNGCSVMRYKPWQPGGPGVALTHNRPMHFLGANTLRSISSTAQVTPGTRGVNWAASHVSWSSLW